MGKLKLHIEDPLQGAFDLSDLNLLFTFQVNCPGCFSYGFPLFESLREKYSSSISFLGLSTAFEDYEFNNVENTKALIEEGELVGETLKMFESNGFSRLPYPVKFPISMDKVADSTFDFDGLADAMCQQHPNFAVWSSHEKKQIQGRIKSHYLQQERISLTFSLNQFQGTPTFVLFNKEYEILTSWFGHLPLDQVESTIASYVRR